METVVEPPKLLDGQIEVKMPANGWRPRVYQAPFWDYMQRTPFSARAILCHHRRAGKDHTAINWCATASQQRVGLYLHIFPFTNQGRRIVWVGRDKDGAEFLDAFPGQIREAKNNVDMRLTLTNGSIYQVIGADDPDKLVGVNPLGVIFSEFALMDPQAWDLIRPILNENRGWALFPSTPRGKNHYYDLIRLAMRNPRWFVSIKTVEDTKSISLDLIEEDRQMGMADALIKQEYWCSFEAVAEGSYYERQMNFLMDQGRINDDVCYDPALPVCTAWDLGLDDATAIWFIQRAPDVNRVIFYMEIVGEGLSHCVSEVMKKLTELDAVADQHWAPHDINVREYSTGQTRISLAAQLGFRFTPVRKVAQKADMIDATRAMIPKCVFNDSECRRGIQALKSYRKTYDEKLKTYKANPVHDWSSHAADAFGSFALGAAASSVRRDTGEKRQTHATNSYNEFG